MVIFFFLCLVFLSPLPVDAAPSLILNTELGIGGWVVPGTFTPLRVDISAPEAAEGVLEVVVPALGRDPPVGHLHPVQLAPGARQQIAFDVVISDPRRPLTLTIRSNREVVVSREIAIGAQRSAEGVVAALTHEAAGLEFLSESSFKFKAAYLREEDLPLRWQSYGAVELLALRDINSRALLPDQVRALTQWVAQGGRLVITPHEGSVTPEWLEPMLPARVDATRLSPAPGVPVRVARLEPTSGEVVRRAGTIPIAVRGSYGRGIVEVWAFDAFVPASRAWPGRVSLWQSVLQAPRTLPLAQDAIAAELPRTRALPGSTQATLGILSVIYIVVLRIVMRRLGGRRGGVVGILAIAAAFSLVLFTFATRARATASALAQFSIAEPLQGAGSARVTTYASLITPYGGDFSIRIPEGAAVRRLGAAAYQIIEADRTIRGSAAAGHALLQAIQIVPFNVSVEAHASEGLIALAIGGSPSVPVRDAVLYRDRQVYRLPDGIKPGRIRVDAARWDRADSLDIFEGEPAGRAMEWLFGQLDRAAGADFWLVARVNDARLEMQLTHGAPGATTQVLVVPVRVR